MPEYIEMTPTWYGLLPAMLAVLRNPNADIKSIRSIMSEFEVMAEGADKWNEYVREQEVL